ncbi:MAG: FaeA/PapI family transcriptional regulator [Halobacteriota archaeon]
MSRLTELRNGGDDKDDQILAAIARRPGALAKDIAAATGIGIFSVRYRLLTLEAALVVRSQRTRNRVHYYVQEIATEKEEKSDVSAPQSRPNMENHHDLQE